MRGIVSGLLLLTVGIGSAGANVGPPSWGGQVAGEPLGIRDIRIDRETLVIDLRPVATSEPARVEATYYLHNAGPSQALELLFASGSDSVEGFEVAFNGQSVPVSPADPRELPPSWKPPRETPGLDDRKLEYSPGVRSHGPISPVQFALTIPPGEHTLRVRYRAEMGTNYLGFPTVYRQFAYVLAPARSWAGFGQLDVTVALPAGWSVVTHPELTRDGDILRGTFEGVPADSLAITLQAQPGPAYDRLVSITRTAFWATILSSLLLAVVLGRWAGRRTAAVQYSRPPRIWPIALISGVIGGIAFGIAGWFKVYGAESALPVNEISHSGYGQLFEFLAYGFLAPGVAVAGFLVTYIRGVLSAQRNSDR
jgi:hypothetical protein